MINKYSVTDRTIFKYENISENSVIMTESHELNVLKEVLPDLKPSILLEILRGNEFNIGYKLSCVYCLIQLNCFNMFREKH